GLTMVARGKEVIVVGAGDAGRVIVQEMQRSRMLNYTPIGFVDDDPRKRHTRIMGVRVLGTIDELPRVLREHRPDEVLIAMPSVSGDVRRRIFETAQPLRIVVKTLPGLYELISGDLNLAGQIRPVQVEDVLGREQVEFGVERFVFISTDKAVNPKTVMGQSKALCEWIVESFGHRRDVATRFVAVRFGNVLNSSGSVIPIFRKQIERGGPVTVTHPEMTRYFMTIPEAVSLVVQAGAIGGRGQVFVLDMGEPVRIVDLAQNMIRLSGKEPRLPDDPTESSRDVRIAFVGSRPGEKIHEE